MNVKKVRQEYITYGDPYPFGKLVTIEGLDCSGKTTLWNQLKEHFPAALYLKGSPHNIKSGEVPDYSINFFCHYFSLLMKNTIIPAMQQGALVIIDRFIDSTIAYQGGGCGHDLSHVRDLTFEACKGVLPHLTLYLSMLPDESLKRLKLTEGDDVRAGTAFMGRVKRTYDKLKDSNPERIIPVTTKHHKAKTVLSQSLILINDLLGVNDKP